MKYYLLDAFPVKTGMNRFYISTSPSDVFMTRCVDNSYQKVLGSWKLLLNCWEGLSLPKSIEIASRTALSVVPMPISAKLAKRKATC